MKASAHTSTVVLVLSLTACGGSGGDGSNSFAAPSAPQTPAAPTVKISESNAKQIASSATDNTNVTLGAGQVGGAVAKGVNFAPNLPSLNPPSLGVLIVAESQLLLATSAGNDFSRSSVRAVNANTQTVNCSISGSIAVTPADTNGNGFMDAGDKLTVQANNCVDTYTFGANTFRETVNGTLAYAITKTSGSPGTTNFQFGASVTLTNVTVTDNNGASTSNGAFNFVLTRTPTAEIVAVDSGNLSVVANGDTATLSGFAVNRTDNLATNAYSETFSGTATDPVLGTYSISTLNAFTGIGTAKPTSGKLKITGDKSSLVIVPQPSGVAVLLGVDKDNDGVTDATITTTWSELESLAATF